MKTLDRYILRGFVVNYLIALLVMIGLYLLVDLSFNLDEFSTGADPGAWGTLRRILDYYGYNMLLYFAQLSGVITLVAACCTLARMHRANELTAVLASGTSLHRVAVPVIVAGIVMNVLWAVDQEIVIPRFADKLARPHDDIEGRSVNPVWFIKDRDNALVSAQRYVRATGEIRGLIVMSRDADGQMTGVLRADAARWDESRRTWVLTRGVRETPRRAADGPLDEETWREPADHFDADLRPQDLVLQQATQWTSFVSLRQLTAAQRRFPDDASLVKTRHARIITPIMNMILLLLGVPFFLTRERTPIVVMGGRCLLLCGLCFLAAFVAQSVDFSGVLGDPALPVWIPAFIFGPAAILTITDVVKT